MRQQAKDLIFKTYVAGQRLGGRFRGGADERIVVLCYHRVSDALRDHVTIGVDQFDQQIAFLKANYHLVSLRELIEGNLPEPASRPLAAVTFDDGYLDNYENAFPILQKHGASATFFVSTDHISEGKPFAHDLEKLGRGLPNMSWDQIREMHRAGMDFGSHTANHVDLGKVDAATAWKELVRSDAAVKKELGITQNLFAFPFGRPQHMTLANHALVKKAGYRCCCSAHGGLNGRASLDRFDVKRIGINYGFSLPALEAYMAGWSRSHANAT
jgi:peptidoglycan/xylan/chitin deacetylase (PgdA/CDA1 family)